MPVTEEKLATYLTSTLKALLEAGNYIVVNYSTDKDMIERSTGPDGRIDSDQLFRNVSRVVDFSIYDSDRLYEVMNRDKVSATLFSVVERGRDGKNRLRCHAAIDSKERNRIDAILTSLNKVPQYGEKSREQLAAYCADNRQDVVTIKNIPAEVYEEMRKGIMPETQYCVDRNPDDSYNLKLPASHQEQALEAYKNAMFVCSGHAWEALSAQREEDLRSYSSAVSATLDSKKTCIIVNPDNPSIYIRTDSDGLHLYAHTKSGEIECDGDSSPRINKAEYEQQAYNLIRMMKGGRQDLVVLAPADKEAEKKLEQMREKAPVKREATMEDKVMYYKRAFAKHVVYALNNDLLNREHVNRMRMKDDMERLSSARDHDVMTGNDAQKGDRDGDRAMLGRALSGGIPESSKDLSDLQPDEFYKEFCDQKLGTYGMNDQERAEYLESIEGTEACVEQLAAEPDVVRIAVINDLDESTREIQQIEEPEMERMTARDLAQEQERSEDEIVL